MKGAIRIVSIFLFNREPFGATRSSTAASVQVVLSYLTTAKGSWAGDEAVSRSGTYDHPRVERPSKSMAQFSLCGLKKTNGGPALEGLMLILPLKPVGRWREAA